MSNTSLPGFLRSRAVSHSLLAAVIVAALAGGCSSSPTSPTPTPTPIPTPTPDPDPPTITCPAPVTASTTAAEGTTVTFAAPAVSAGKEPVTVACTPASGSMFPLGATTVNCTATDALNRTNSCSFTVSVSKTPQLTVTKFLAFGDSITAGEISFPIAGISPQGGFANSILRVVPSASYPSVLSGLLRARYTAQSSGIVVANEGVSGERARDAATLSRFSQAVSTHRPDVVLLMHGYNDIIDPSVITATVNAVDAMAAEARNRRVARVVVINLAPPRAGGNNSRPATTIDAFNERLQRAAAGEGALYVDIFSALSSSVSTYIGVDGLHPNEAGYRKIAETVLAAIQSNFEVR